MAHQPQEKPQCTQSIVENNTLKTSQFSQNNIEHPKTTFNFSPLTIISDGPSTSSSPSNNCLPYNAKDADDISKGFSITPDLEKTIDEYMNNNEFDFDNWSCSVSDVWIEQELNSLDIPELENIDKSIQHRIMSVKAQPAANIRRRYESDGKRQIEQSRCKPMAISLPDLNNCKLNSNQSFWIQLLLITYSKNPGDKIYNHIDKLEYHVDDLPECDHGFVRIPLTQVDIEKGIKEFARISIIKTKLDKYTFDLIPFNPLPNDNQTEIYENKNTKTIVAKAKCFRDEYNLKSSRIACQLVIKQNETWHMTNIICETGMMEEKSTKRSAVVSNSDDDDEEKCQIPSPTPAKKRKQSSSLMRGLPIARVKK